MIVRAWLLSGLVCAVAAGQPVPTRAQAAASGAAAPDGAASLAMRAEARSATERRDFAAALPLYEQLLAQAPADADLLIEAARVFGWADRNGRSADLYRQALAAAPARRADIVPSLAWQTLWAADATTALPLFEEAARLRPGDRALAWGLGHVLNATGRHREALATFRRWAPPATDAERLDLARAWRWAGYEDRAEPLLRDAREPEAVWLREHRLARDIAPYAFGSLELTEDRDTLRSRSLVLGAGWQAFAGITVELGGRHVGLDDDFGTASARSFEASARGRWGEPDSPWGTFWPQVALRQHSIGGWHPTTSALRLKWVPADRWRVDAERTRELVETPRAFANRVTVDVSSIGADWRRDERLMLTGALARLRFDDGTVRQRVVARAEWAWLTRPRWTFGAELHRFERTQEGAPGADARGYWNPRRYDEQRLFSAYTWERRPWDLQARLGLGRSREVDSAGNVGHGSPHLWEVALGYDVSPSLRWRVAAGGSGQGLGLSGSGASGAGYWRRWAQVGLNGWF